MNQHICIWKHIIKSNNINLNKYITILESSDIKKCNNETWKGKKNQFELAFIM